MNMELRPKKKLLANLDAATIIYDGSREIGATSYWAQNLMAFQHGHGKDSGTGECQKKFGGVKKSYKCVRENREVRDKK
jgi:hypothetical protein